VNEAVVLALAYVSDGYSQVEASERTGVPLPDLRRAIEAYADAAVAQSGHSADSTAREQSAGPTVPTVAGLEADRRVFVTLASTYRPRPVRWLWTDRVPEGAITLLAGREGIGKSLITVNRAAALTRGTLNGSRYGRPSRVLFATSEDAWEFTMVPRLLAADADLDAVGRVQVDDRGIVTGLTLPVDVLSLKQYVRAADVALLVLDPLTSVMDGALDHHRDREVRVALEPLARLAEETGCAVVGLVHLGKSTSTDPVNLILGSRAFSAVARVALVAARDPDEDDGSCVLSVEKSNLGRLDMPALTYRVDGAEVMTDEGTASAGLLVWTGETERRVRDIMAGPEEEGHAVRDEAADWLRGYLADNGGEAAFSDLSKAARANGHAERTLRRAARRAGVVITSSGFPRRTVWQLETVSQQSRRPSLTLISGHRDSGDAPSGGADE